VFEWSGTAWLVSIAVVVASGAVAFGEGNGRRRPGLDIGFINHGGMWGDALLLPVANALVIPRLSAGWWMLGPALLAAIASIAVHHWWHGGAPHGMRDHMWPARPDRHWATDLSIAGWCHVLYVAGELTVLLAYGMTPVPPLVVVAVAIILSVHVPIGLLQPGWFATGRVLPAGTRLTAAVLVGIWIATLAKLSP